MGTTPNASTSVVSIADARHRPRTVAIGSFDGVHIGHRAVIRGCDTVLTFTPHPLRVLRPDSAPALLTDLERKVAKLAALGVHEVVLIPFDASLAEQPAAAFVDEVLVGRLNASSVSVGFNFRYGARAAGTPSELRRDSRFRTRVVPPVVVGSTVVSSTAIRTLVDQGEVVRAGRLLGAPLAHPATLDENGDVHFAPGLAVPAAGTYACDVGGMCSYVSFDGRPHLTRTAGPRAAGRRETIVTFLDGPIEFLQADPCRPIRSGDSVV